MRVHYAQTLRQLLRRRDQADALLDAHECELRTDGCAHHAEFARSAPCIENAASAMLREP